MKKGLLSLSSPSLMVHTLVSFHLSLQYKACRSAIPQVLPSTYVFCPLLYYHFPPTPPHFSSVLYLSLSDQNRGGACRAHQRDVGQQCVQTLWRIFLITSCHAVILRDTGKKKEDEKWGAEVKEEDEREKACEQMLNKDVCLSQNKRQIRFSGCYGSPRKEERHQYLFAFACQSWSL